MASFVLSDAARDLLGDALNAALDDGVLELLTDAVLKVTLTLPDVAANTSVNGVVTLGTIAPAAATGAGVVNVAKFYSNGKAALLATADVGLPASGASVILDNTNIAVDQVVNISSCVITVPAGT